MNHPYFIINPVAGGGKSLHAFARAEVELRRRGVEYTALYSERPGHAAELTRHALLSDASCVVAVGGDGTVQEVAAALIGKKTPMGILPMGTGNDVIKALGIPAATEDALALLLEGSPRRVDLATANGRTFINVSGMGFDVDVLTKTRHYKTIFRGSFAYILGLLHALVAMGSHRVVVRTPEQTLELDALMVSVGNGTHIGGGMKVTPLADMSDGLLDVCVVRRVGRLRVLRCLARFIKGNHLELDIIQYFRATSLVVESAPTARVQLDGEIVEHTPVEFQVIPSALWVITPPVESSSELPADLLPDDGEPADDSLLRHV